MPGGRPKAPLRLTDEERGVLDGYARRRTTAQALALRARIVLRSAAGADNVAVACALLSPRRRAWYAAYTAVWSSAIAS